MNNVAFPKNAQVMKKKFLALTAGLLFATTIQMAAPASAAVQPAKPFACPPGRVIKSTPTGKVCVKPQAAYYSIYRGPVVYGKLPFPAHLPSGLSSARVAAEFAKDAAAIVNCASGLFNTCARKVWGRTDPGNMGIEGRSAAYEIPWVKLFAKYAAAGVKVSHDLGDWSPGAYTNTDPVFASTYRLDFADGTFLWVDYENASGSANPGDWLVPGCRMCARYNVL